MVLDLVASLVVRAGMSLARPAVGLDVDLGLEVPIDVVGGGPQGFGGAVVIADPPDREGNGPFGAPNGAW